MVTGDMNAKAGEDGSQADPVAAVMGNHGLGERDTDGDMNTLVTTGTLFPHKDIRYTK